MTRASLFALFALVLFGCDDTKDKVPEDDIGDSGNTDTDGDGDPDNTDCAPDDPLISQYAAEVCDGIDNDCDDDIDDDDSNLSGGTSTWYIDQDGDDYGSPDEEYEACEAPYTNAVEAGGDCDDDDSTVNPGEDEVCDGVDNDCSGDIDDNPTDGIALYEDSDGDGYGDPEAGELRCEVDDGWSEDGTDCDDGDNDINPGHAEVCFNEIDDNCDEAIDDTCPQDHCGDISTSETWSSDGYGHYVSCDIRVEGATSPVLTIEGGTKVYFAEGVGLYVGHEDAGSIVIDGGALPVEFTSGLPITDPDEGLRGGLWSGLVLGPYTDTDDVSIVGLELSYGGGVHAVGSYTDQAGLLVSGPSLTLERGSYCGNSGSGIVAADGAMLNITDIELCDNEEHGFYADDSSGLDGGSPSFSSNDVSGNGDYPVSVLARYGGEIENTTTFDGHSSDVAYIELRGDDVDGSLTLEAQDYPYYISSDVAVWGSATPKMTINDGVEMYFGNDVDLSIGNSRGPGSLIVDGTSLGVVMTALDPSNGWGGLTISTAADTVDLEGITIEYGGDNGLANFYIENGSSGVDVDVNNCTIAHSSEYGVYVGVDAEPSFSYCTIAENGKSGVFVSDTSTGEGGLTAFTGNTVTSNAGYPLEVPAAALGALDGGGSYTGNDDDYIYVTESTVEEDADWSDLDVDYWVSGVIDIEGSYGPVVVIEGGATFLMESSSGVNVGDGRDGALSTDGDASNTVTFTSSSSSPGPGDWDGIKFGPDAISASSELNGLEVLYAGSSRTGAVEIERVSPVFNECHIAYSSYDGVYVTGTSSAVAEPEFVDCTVEENDSSGFNIGANAGLGDFDSNVVTNNGGYAVELYAKYAHELDTGSTYSPNGDEGVLITEGTLSGSSVSVSWADLGVPYVLDDDLDVKGSAALTLKAGTELKFNADKGFNVGVASTGSLTVSGTSSKHVTITSAEASPAAGDWLGLAVGKLCYTVGFTYLDVDYGVTNFDVNCAKTMSFSNSSFTNSTTYDINCGSLSRSITWSSITYSTQTGCSI